MTTEQLIRRAERELGERGRVVAFALAVGCTRHGNSQMDYDSEGAFCGACDREATLRMQGR